MVWRIGPRRKSDPFSECPLSASAIFGNKPRLCFSDQLEKFKKFECSIVSNQSQTERNNVNLSQAGMPYRAIQSHIELNRIMNKVEQSQGKSNKIEQSLTKFIL